MASPSFISPPRRSTRASVARFAFSEKNPDTEQASSVVPAADIEDAVLPIGNTRKRRRPGSSTPSAIASRARPRKSEKVNVALPSPLNENEPPSTVNTSPSPKAPKRARKPARKTVDPATGESVVSPPSDWAEVYDVVRQMRALGGAAANAAVDTMGCERLADRDVSPRDQRFHTLIALMLSSQTKDTVNAIAMRRLQTELPPHKPGAPSGLNLENVLAVDSETLHELIRVVGFHNNKTKYIKQAAEILRDRWDGDIPDTIAGLTSLPGVGPKMGYLCLSSAWDRTEGIGVDVHVHRITNLWGWHATRTPEETRLALQTWLPRDRWREINWLLVGLGQAVCLPVGRRCGDCELGLRGLCKAADKGKVAEGRRRQEDIKIESALKGEEEKKEQEGGLNGTKIVDAKLSGGIKEES